MSLMEKNYSKPFGESLFKTIKNYSHYSPMLNWRTIGGTIEINRQKLLKCSNYSPVLNYTRKKLILEEFPNSSETEDMRKIR